MTNEEALKILNYTPVTISASSETTVEQYHQMLHIAEKAIEKQIARKPFRESLADRLCPVCGAYIKFDALNEKVEEAPEYCSNCGQKIDWRDVK